MLSATTRPDGPVSWIFALVMALGLLPRPVRVAHVGIRCSRDHACQWRVERDGCRYVFGGSTSESGLRHALRYFDGLADPITETGIVIDALELHQPRGRYS